MTCQDCKLYEERAENLRAMMTAQNDDVCQELGKALGYMWFKDDQETFPGATEEDGVFVPECCAVVMAENAAARIRKLEGEVRRLKQRLHVR